MKWRRSGYSSMASSSNSLRPVIICPRTSLPQVRHTQSSFHFLILIIFPVSLTCLFPHASISLSLCLAVVQPAALSPIRSQPIWKEFVHPLKCVFSATFISFFILSPLPCERPCLSINQQRACLFQGHLGSIPLNKRNRRNDVTLDKTSAPSLVF